MRPGYADLRNRWTTRAGEWCLFALAWSMRFLTWPVPMWVLSRALSAVGAPLALAIPRFRRRLDDNIAHVWPELPLDERRTLAAGAARSFIELAVEYARLDTFTKEVRLETHGMEHLIDAQTAGQGAVIVTAHYGNWEAIRFAAKEAGVEVGIIYRAFNNRYLDRFTLDLIHRAGRPVLQKGRKGMRALRQHVAAGGAAMILVDQRTTGAPVLDFLGQPAETVTVASDLALKTGARLIPAVAVRDRAARTFHVTMETPITGAESLSMTQAVNDRIGAWIKAEPAQWFWFHRRWRTTRARVERT